MKRKNISRKKNNSESKKLKKDITKKKKDKYHIHQCINTIKRRFLKYLDNRYNHIDNNDEYDVISYKKITRIPKNNLYIFNLSNGKKMGCECLTLIKWYSTIISEDFDDIILKNIFTNEELSIEEIKNIFNFGSNFFNSNVFFKKYYINNYEKEFDIYNDALNILDRYIYEYENPINYYELILNKLEYNYKRLEYYRNRLKNMINDNIIENRCLCIHCLEYINQDNNLLNNNAVPNTFLARITYRVNCILTLENEINLDFPEENYNPLVYDIFLHENLNNNTVNNTTIHI
jgi:hypothetical protein